MAEEGREGKSVEIPQLVPPPNRDRSSPDDAAAYLTVARLAEALKVSRRPYSSREKHMVQNMVVK